MHNLSTPPRQAQQLKVLRAWSTLRLPGRCKSDVLRPGIVRRDVRVLRSYDYGHA